MPQVLLKLIEDLHTGTTSRVRLGGLMSDSFSTSSGVRRGWILSPALFCRAIDWIIFSENQLTKLANLVQSEDLLSGDWRWGAGPLALGPPLVYATGVLKAYRACSLLVCSCANLLRRLHASACLNDSTSMRTCM